MNPTTLIDQAIVIAALHQRVLELEQQLAELQQQEPQKGPAK